MRWLGSPEVSDHKKYNWGKVLRYAMLGVGIGLTAFSIISGVVSTLSPAQVPVMPQAMVDSSKGLALSTSGVSAPVSIGTSTSFDASNVFTESFRAISNNPYLLIGILGVASGTALFFSNILKLPKNWINIKKRADNSLNLKYFAYKVIQGFKSRAKENSMALLKNFKKNYLVQKDFTLLKKLGKIKDITDIVGPEGKIKYDWVGFTYRFLDKDSGYYQVGLTTVPHPIRLNYYLWDLIAHPWKRTFKKTGEKQIYGWIVEYLDKEYGLSYFRDQKGRPKMDLIFEKVFENFEFEITGVFWNLDALRIAEIEQIAVGKLGSQVDFVQKWLEINGYNLGHDDPEIQAILEKYGLGNELIGKALNDPTAAGVGGTESQFIWLIGFYTALGYSLRQMHKSLEKYHSYIWSYGKFKKEFYQRFDSIKTARDLFTSPTRDLLLKEGLTKSEIDKLMPLLKAFDEDEFLSLAETGLKLQDIARKLGWDRSHLGRLVRKIIDEKFPDLPMYKFTSGKTEVSWEDLQYYLIGCKILGGIYQGVERQVIVDQFKTIINPNGISFHMFDEICKRVLGGLYKELKDEAREILLSIIVMDINPSKVADISQDIRNWMPHGTITSKLFQFFKSNELVQRLILSGKKLTAIQVAKVALLGPQLLRFYKQGFSDQIILNELSSAYTLKDIVELTDLILDMTPDEARLFLKSRKIN